MVVRSVARYVVQEIEQSLQRLPVLVRQKQQHALHRVRPQINRYICNNYGTTPVIIFVPMLFLHFVDKSLVQTYSKIHEIGSTSDSLLIYYSYIDETNVYVILTLKDGDERLGQLVR